jgi:DNA adenine methylase
VVRRWRNRYAHVMQTTGPRISLISREAAGADAKRGALPLLTWAGGKRALLHDLLRYVPATLPRYFEPFAGGATLFFNLAPQRAVLADANAQLISLYEVVRDQPEALIRALDVLQPHVLDAEFYYKLRARPTDTLDPVQRAARLIYLNKTCYNGLYRENRRGQFNVPFGRYHRPPALYNPDNLRAAATVLARATLLCADFEQAVAGAEPGDFVYFDPPYVPLNATASFTRYTRASFGEREQRRLADVFRALAERGCRVLLSNSDTPLVRALYAGFPCEVVRASRNINSRADGRAQIAELLVSNEPPARRD